MSYRIIWHHSGVRLTVKLETSRFPGVLRGPIYVRPGKKSHLRDLFLVSRGKQGQEGLGTSGMGDGCTTCYFGVPHRELTATYKWGFLGQQRFLLSSTAVSSAFPFPWSSYKMTDCEPRKILCRAQCGTCLNACFCAVEGAEERRQRAGKC